MESSFTKTPLLPLITDVQPLTVKPLRINRKDPRLTKVMVQKEEEQMATTTRNLRDKVS